MNKFESFIDKFLQIFLLVLFFGGFAQFTAITIITIFGVQLEWLQYMASAVLFLLGVCSLLFWARFTNSE